MVEDVFSRRVFLASGIYGLIVLVPMYFLEARLNQDMPPAITHPEYFYGFLGVAVAWQLLFLVISRDPARYRPVMLPAFLEKLGYGGAVLVLAALGRAAGVILVTAVIDLALGLLFLMAFTRTPEPRAGAIR